MRRAQLASSSWPRPRFIVLFCGAVADDDFGLVWCCLSFCPSVSGRVLSCRKSFFWCAHCMSVYWWVVVLVFCLCCCAGLLPLAAVSKISKPVLTHSTFHLLSCPLPNAAKIFVKQLPRQRNAMGRFVNNMHDRYEVSIGQSAFQICPFSRETRCIPDPPPRRYTR